MVWTIVMLYVFKISTYLGEIIKLILHHQFIKQLRKLERDWRNEDRYPIIILLQKLFIGCNTTLISLAWRTNLTKKMTT